MIGTLYRYPHPTNPNRILYVGQGAKRDCDHRAGRTSFGRRFCKLFPFSKLPQPIRWNVEIINPFELNELETIAIFQYHSWHGYEGGMNLEIPGGVDYKNAGILAGRKNVESGHASFIGRKYGSINGKIGGRKNAENGHCARISHLGGIKRFELYGSPATHESNIKGGRIGNCKRWNINKNKSCVCGYHNEQVRNSSMAS